MLRRILGAGVLLAAFAAACALAVYLLALPLRPAHAGDPTGFWKHEYEAGRSPPPTWWNALASGKGLCCSFADGVPVTNVDWDTGGPAGEFRVRLHGAWFVVPEAAVVAEPNRYGPAVVWLYTDTDGGTQIRCFLPGAGA